MRPYGLNVAVRSNHVPMLERIKREVLLPHWEVLPLLVNLLYSFFVGGEVRKGTRKFSLLYEADERIARSLDTEEVYRVFEETFHRRVTGLATQTYVRGVALAVRGQAEVFLGQNGNFVYQYRDRLEAAGASLLAPEFVSLHEGQVGPYHNRALIGSERTEPQALGLPLRQEPLPLGRLWLLQPELDEGPLSPGRSAFHLFESLVRIYDSSGAVQELGALARSTPAVSVREPESAFRILSEP